MPVERENTQDCSLRGSFNQAMNYNRCCNKRGKKSHQYNRRQEGKKPTAQAYGCLSNWLRRGRDGLDASDLGLVKGGVGE